MGGLCDCIYLLLLLNLLLLQDIKRLGMYILSIGFNRKEDTVNSIQSYGNVFYMPMYLF